MRGTVEKLIMDSGPLSQMLVGSNRLHLNHGPIDLVIEAFGDNTEVISAYKRAEAYFNNILAELAADLFILRTPISKQRNKFISPVSIRMQRAVQPFYPTFITPMAAVAGSVADYILSILCEGKQLRKAYVNNGGDIAIYLTDHEVFNIGIFTDPRNKNMAGSVSIGKTDYVSGIATSGRHGRSHSLGIADAVTVLATNAAQADAAATLIANAVDLPHSSFIERLPANELSPDSDLGDRLVTTGVAHLPTTAVDEAIMRGCELANTYIDRGLIKAAWVSLQGVVRIVGPSHFLTEDRN